MNKSNVYSLYICIDPQGKKHQVKDLVDHCYAYNLDYAAMVNCANGYIKSHRGWQCRHYKNRFYK